MGYNMRADGLPNFSKAVISFWFWVPQASIDACIADYEGSGVAEGSSADLNLRGFIPLITFGPNGTVVVNEVGSGSTSPCMIGINCRDYFEEYIDAPSLYVRLQYTTGLPAWVSETTIMQQPDCFRVGGRSDMDVSAIPNIQNIPITPDAWHHVLVSFDVSGGCSTSALEHVSACDFWWAFDDVNYDSEYLWPGSLNPSGVLSSGANKIVSMWCQLYEFEGATSHSFAAGALATSGNEMGAPSTANNAARIRNVVMADIQVFTDVTLDTSVEDNRRAFVTSSGHPASPALAAALLEKEPEVLHIGDWLAGTNSGTGGPFTPTGTLTSFAPTP